MTNAEGRWMSFTLVPSSMVILEKKNISEHLSKLENLDVPVTVQSLLSDLQDLGEVTWMWKWSKRFFWSVSGLIFILFSHETKLELLKPWWFVNFCSKIVEIHLTQVEVDSRPLRRKILIGWDWTKTGLEEMMASSYCNHCYLGARKKLQIRICCHFGLLKGGVWGIKINKTMDGNVWPSWTMMDWINRTFWVSFIPSWHHLP